MQEHRSGYVSIIGSNFLYPIVRLFEELEKMGPKPPNEVQAGPYENGYSVAIIGLSIFMVESYINRARFIIDSKIPIPGKHNALTFFKKQFDQNELYEKLRELFVVRDTIVHNHPWEAMISSSADGLKFEVQPQHPSDKYGDKKFLNAIDLPSRKTKILKINLFPTRISYDDVKEVLKTSYEILTFIESTNKEYCVISYLPVNFYGKEVNFSDFIESLDEPVSERFTKKDDDDIAERVPD